MNPIGKPVTASVYMENSRENFRQGEVDRAAARSQMRSAISGYPNTLTDTLIKNIGIARKINSNANVNLRGSGIITDESA